MTYEEWIEENPELQTLVEEWVAMGRDPHIEVSNYIDRKERLVYVVQSSHGYHESLESHTDALRMMIEAHR